MRPNLYCTVENKTGIWTLRACFLSRRKSSSTSPWVVLLNRAYVSSDLMLEA